MQSRITHIADDSESQKKVIEFQRRAGRFGNAEDFSISRMTTGGTDDFIRSVDLMDDDELIDVEAADPPPRFFSSAGNKFFRGPPTLSARPSNYKIKSPGGERPEHTFASRYGDEGPIFGTPFGVRGQLQQFRHFGEDKRTAFGPNRQEMQEQKREKKMDMDRERLCRKVEFWMEKT